MSEPLRIWSALERTNPIHTKGFKRSGGFVGTAVRPIYNTLRLTELFGPCGEGWGTFEPSFTIQAAAEEILVFCTVGLWYRLDGTISAPIYGVGGDKLLIKGKEGLRSSDEAFKSAYTDAVGNAMKQLGMSADIHMGRFDDHKYVNELRAEFAEEETQARQPPPSPPPPPRQPAPSIPETPNTDEARKRLEDRDQAARIRDEIKTARTGLEVDEALNSPLMDYFRKARPDIYSVLIGIAERRRDDLDAAPF